MSTESANTTDALITMLDAVDAFPGAAELRSHSYDLLHLPERAPVVDVGCGAGRAVAELHDRGMRAIGIDSDDRMIDVARMRWPDTEFHIGDAYALPVDDGTVAGYRADKVLHSLDDPGRAVAEAHRVLRGDGRIVLVGQDWDGIVIDSEDPALTRTIVHARADALPSPRAARGYRNLLLRAGFHDPSVEVHTGVFTDATMLPMLTGLAETAATTGAITPEQADAWINEQTARGTTGTSFLAVPLFVASARKPFEQA